MKLREQKGIKIHINNSIHKSHRIESVENIEQRESRMVSFVLAYVSVRRAFLLLVCFLDFTHDRADWIACFCTHARWSNGYVLLLRLLVMFGHASHVNILYIVYACSSMWWFRLFRSSFSISSRSTHTHPSLNLIYLTIPLYSIRVDYRMCPQNVEWIARKWSTDLFEVEMNKFALQVFEIQCQEGKKGWSICATINIFEFVYRKTKIKCRKRWFTLATYNTLCVWINLHIFYWREKFAKKNK